MIRDNCENIDDINREIVKFNENDTSVMTIQFDGSFSTLFIDGNKITSDYNLYVLERIKQINRENGYNYL